MPLDMGDPTEWMALAKEDLGTAVRILRETEPPFKGTGCFHIQQAVEKTLKALLAARGVEPPRTHNVRRLFEMLGPDLALDRLRQLEDTTYFAVLGRYGDFDLPELEVILRHLATAERLFNWAEKTLQK